MVLIVCVDEKMGMLFNHRRQSSDRNLIKYLSDRFKKITVCEYSAGLFSEFLDCIQINNNPRQSDCFFLEDNRTVFFHSDTIVLCRWNRIYPADIYCSADFSEYNLVSSEKIIGSCHEEIIIDTFLRKKQA